MIPTAAEEMRIPSGEPLCSPRPVFVIGAMRSGASLLTLSLGQHANLRLVLANSWFERFAMGLSHAYADGVRPRATSELDVSGIELDDFFAHFGEAIDRLLILDPPDDERVARRSQRWVDGTPTHAFHTFLLMRLFPQARFIHVLRDVEGTVATLASEEIRPLYKSQHVLLSERDAYLHWLDAVNACVTAERAFGSETVLRVRRADLIEAPARTICRCLAFLGEPDDPACLRPFSSVDPAVTLNRDRGEAPSGKACPPELRTAAALLSDTLLEETTPAYSRDEARIAELEAAFHTQCRRGQSAVPQRPPFVQKKKKAAARPHEHSRVGSALRGLGLNRIRHISSGHR